MKPLLASSYDPRYPLQFPLVASPKIDGMRCLIKGGKALSRSLKPIPNLHTQFLLSSNTLEGLDGELVVGSATDNNVMQATTSGMMSIEGNPDVTYFVFDRWDCPNVQYLDRLERIKSINLNYVKILEHTIVNNINELNKFEVDCLTAGYEGVMVRDPRGLYKYGRSTAKEGILLKIKRFDDAEARVIGFEERQHNENEAKTNALGRTERSSAKEGKTPAGDLGALVCETTDGIVFKIGTGFSGNKRLELWSDREKLIGQLVKYKYFATGIKEAPRFPVFICFRPEIDL